MARVPLEPAAMDRPRNCAPPCGKILARCVAAIEGRELQVRPILYSEAYKRVVTLLLTAAYTFNSMDRSIVSIIASPMKLDLKLTDTELGLLGGTAFAVLYALGGVPLARLAERVNRVGIITAALIVWSGLTALCGAARTFPQLLLIRAGVGVAEAGCSPPAHSLISDCYEPSRRTSALSIYTCGISLGYILAAVVGGYVAQHFGWRIACATVGLPGIATAVLIKIFVREPPRGYSDASAPAACGAAPFSLRFPRPPQRAVVCPGSGARRRNRATRVSARAARNELERGDLGVERRGILSIRLARSNVRCGAKCRRYAAPRNGHRPAVHLPQRHRARLGPRVHRLGYRPVRGREPCLVHPPLPRWRGAGGCAT